MRRFPKRPGLLSKLNDKLEKETTAIVKHADPGFEADKHYKRARQAKWFKPIIRTLQKLSGPGQRCMFCSGSEASDVEHYRPKSVFPDLTMTWDNFLWSCTPCNRGKQNRFPPDTEPGGRFVNPMVEDAWSFFFIDEFGLLTPVYETRRGALNGRAVTTRDFLDLNREAVQESRLYRFNDLTGKAKDTLRLLQLREITKAEARARIAVWRAQPFQPDVADYFLDGPGNTETPFKELLESLKVRDE